MEINKMADLYVIHSDFEDEHQYYVVDEFNLFEKTNLIDDYPEFERLDLEEELKALKIYFDGGGENWQVIKGKPNDFFIAKICETKW